MTQIKVDNIADAAGTGAPDFEDGLTVAGSALSTLNTAEYYESGTEPSSPKNGALWKDTANDKLMMYVAGEFKEIELGASAAASWTISLSDVSYDSVSFAVGSQESGCRTLAFSTDGTKMFVSGSTSDSVHQYSLSTGFDLSTASYDSVSFSVSSQETGPAGLTFNADGTKMYVGGFISDTIHQYSLSTAFSLSGASYDNVSLNVSSQEAGPRGITFNNDGTKFYVAGPGSDSILEYALSTPYILSSASYTASLSVVSQDVTIVGWAFNSDGTKGYALGDSTNNIYQYTLSTAYDLTSASVDSGVTFSPSGQESGLEGLAISADGTKLYVIGGGNTVYQYSTGL